MNNLLVNAPDGLQLVIGVMESGSYFDDSRVIWDERIDGELPSITLGGMVRSGANLIYSQPRMDEHIAATQPATPQSVTMRQARLALLAAGLLDTVQAAIVAAGPAAKIEWEYATEVQRSAGLIPAMATALGMTDAQIDVLFVAAAAL